VAWRILTAQSLAGKARVIAGCDRKKRLMTTAAYAIVLFRALMVSLGNGWVGLRTFVTGLRAFGFGRARNLVTDSAPQARWLS
jgi:hypothetical protein